MPLSSVLWLRKITSILMDICSHLITGFFGIFQGLSLSIIFPALQWQFYQWTTVHCPTIIDAIFRYLNSPEPRTSSRKLLFHLQFHPTTNLILAVPSLASCTGQTGLTVLPGPYTLQNHSDPLSSWPLQMPSFKYHITLKIMADFLHSLWSSSLIKWES